MLVTMKWKLLRWSGLKIRQQNFTRQGYMLSFKRRTLQLIEMMSMLSGRDVIHRRLASFWCMINVTVSVIIPILKKKALLFYSPSYINLYWRCPWCNGYRRRKWTRWHEFKSWTTLIAFHIALIPLGKVWIQYFSFQLLVNSRTDWFLQPLWGN